MRKLLHFATSLVLFIGLGFAPLFLNAQTYTTLKDGNFNDPAVWSLDGVTPCSCIPGSETATTLVLNGGTIVINHQMNLAKNLRMLGNPLVVNINSGASLNGGTNRLDIRSGVLNNAGSLTFGDLHIFNGGELNSTGQITVTPGSLIVEWQGRMNAGGQIDIPNGDFINIGMVDILANARVFAGGDMRNDGVLDLEPGACLNITGNVENNYTITLINGPGTAYIQSGGDLTNNHTWDTPVEWCAAGTVIGMTTSPNCQTCGPLPVELISFEARLENNQVVLNWATASETSNSHFTLERSSDGAVFHTLLNLDSESPAYGASYQAVDQNPISGISYYRLSQTDLNGTTTQLSTVALNYTDAEAHFNAFPNPFNETLRITTFGLADQNATLQLLDLSGKVLLSQEIAGNADYAVIELHPGPLPTGLYLVVLSSGNLRETLKLMHP